jgi:EAL domain-containing protein (putative c-di-GMP-specific phosphodiesterase class I)
LRENRALQNDLRIAVELGQMKLHYQPLLRTRGGIAGFEALMRWQHPVQGAISPATFIQLAEDDGSILNLGQWALQEACSAASKWPHDLRISVNLSPVQLKLSNLPAQVSDILASTGLPPRRLELEITESALIDDSERALCILKELKGLGVSIAMDDFGTGFSSLSYLQAFPFDRIKIDRKFISESGGPSLPIIRAIVGLAGGLRLPVTAEGVETAHQLELVTKEGCDEVQGFLLGKPMPIECYGEIVGNAARFPISDVA